MRTLFTWSLAFTLLFAPAADIRADQSDAAASSPAANVQLKNVELSPEGVLHGQLITESGVVMAKKGVKVKMGEEEFKVVTDDAGRFAVSDLQGGRCFLSVGEQMYACRLWMAGTAPPSSLKSIALVGGSGEATVRGQFGGGIRNRLAALTTPQKVGLGLLAAGAVGVAIAVAQDDDASN